MAVNPRRRRSSAPVGITPYGAGGFGARTRTRPQAAPVPTPGAGKGGVGGPAPMPMPPLIPVPQPLPLGPQPQPIQMQPLPEMPQAPVMPPQAPVAGPAPAPTPPAPINDAQTPVGGYQLPNPAPTPPVSDGNFGRVQPMPEPVSPIAMPTPNPVPSAPPANVPAPDQPSTQMPVQAPPMEMPVAPTPTPEQPLQSVGGAGGPPQEQVGQIRPVSDHWNVTPEVRGRLQQFNDPVGGSGMIDPVTGTKYSHQGDPYQPLQLAPQPDQPLQSVGGAGGPPQDPNQGFLGAPIEIGFGGEGKPWFNNPDYFAPGGPGNPAQDPGIPPGAQIGFGEPFNNPDQGDPAQGFFLNNGLTPDNEDYWQKGIDWTTGQDRGQKGELRMGGTTYQPGGDGTYTDASGNKYYDSNAGNFMSQGRINLTKLEPGESAPVPRFGPGKGGVGGNPYVPGIDPGFGQGGPIPGFGPGKGGVGGPAIIGGSPIAMPGGPIPMPGAGKGGFVSGAITGSPGRFDSGTGSPPVMGGGMMMPGSLGDQFAQQSGGMGALTSGALLDPNAPLDQYGNPIVAPDMIGAQAFR